MKTMPCAMTFQEERFTAARAELEPLARAHWDEVEAPLHGQRAYRLHVGHYRTLERLDMLALYTARTAGGQLAGYAAFSLAPCPHRPGLLLAVLDGLYLTPAARQGLTALAFLRWAERRLTARGAGAVQYSSPASRPCGALYRRLGAACTETVWHKALPVAGEVA
ncbi:MAG: GNAT family N-acetyltransferase [Desulfovibrionaceae bacterium]|nr:GNAT family N-acetyltransferase [Desulfovibrionaceae bacterium]